MVISSISDGAIGRRTGPALIVLSTPLYQLGTTAPSLVPAPAPAPARMGMATARSMGMGMGICEVAAPTSLSSRHAGI